jgi:hypothetical protein
MIKKLVSIILAVVLACECCADVFLQIKILILILILI